MNAVLFLSVLFLSKNIVCLISDHIPILNSYPFSVMQDHFKKKPHFPITLKYIDPTYMIRAVKSNASDNVYCTLLAHSALHGAMAGYTGFTVAPVNGRHAYIPFYVSPGPSVQSSSAPDHHLCR